jgi:YVTN family beta-propeller protein
MDLFRRACAATFTCGVDRHVSRLMDEPEGSIGGVPGRAGTPAIVASLALISAMALWSEAAHAQSGPFVYVPNFDAASVARLDIPSGVLAPGAIGVGSQPYAVAVRGDQSLVYVSNFLDGTVSVVDTATNAVVASIAVGGSPARARHQRGWHTRLRGQ